MKKIVVVMACAFSVLSFYAHAGEDEGYETIEERRARLKVLLDTDEIKEKVSSEWIRIAKMILDNDVSSQECTNAAIQYIRNAYARLDPAKDVARYPDHETGELAMALYCFRGTTDAMYEYTKLNGVAVTKLHHIVKNPRWGKDPDLLKYELHVLRKSILEDVGCDYSMTLHANTTDYLSSLRKRYGKQTELVSFCQNLCFWQLPVKRLHHPGLAANQIVDKLSPSDWLLSFFSQGGCWLL